jgi:hypothetical protein
MSVREGGPIMRKWLTVSVCLLIAVLYFGLRIKSKYEFLHLPTAVSVELPGSRLIDSTKVFDLDSPLSWFWPEAGWVFAIPDPVQADRFFMFRIEYGERQPIVFMVDADCSTKRMTWYDTDEPDNVFPARDLYGRPVVAPDGKTYRRSSAQAEPPQKWMHEFCETDWTAERKAKAAE